MSRHYAALMAEYGQQEPQEADAALVCTLTMHRDGGGAQQRYSGSLDYVLQRAMQWFGVRLHGVGSYRLMRDGEWWEVRVRAVKDSLTVEAEVNGDE